MDERRRNQWYKTGRNGDELAGPVTDKQLESLASRGLIFPDTPVGSADERGTVKVWLRAGELVSLLQIFYRTGAMLLEPTKPPPPKPLLETAPLILSDVAATRHVIVTLRSIGVNYVARCVGEPLAIQTHWDANKRPMICLADLGRCKICPSLRVTNAYVDALMHSKTVDGDFYYRAALVLPEAAFRKIDGETVRGRLYKFRRMKGSETAVELVRLQCPYELDQPAEIRHVIIRRFGLWPEWPADESRDQGGESPDVVPFRRQA